jgi:YHS domain-containing protein
LCSSPPARVRLPDRYMTPRVTAISRRRVRSSTKGDRGLVRVCRAVLFATVAAFASSALAGAGTAVNTGYFGDVAIEGYDPVAYFTDGRATKGSEKFAYDWLGATWHFANAEHRELFTKTPVKYAPQYGGHCALGTAFGESTANIDPEAWSIVDGKLYLQYSKGAREAWEQDRADRIAAGDQKWPEVAARLEAESGG